MFILSPLLLLLVNTLLNSEIVEASCKNRKIKGVIAPVFTPYNKYNTSQINYNELCDISSIAQAGVDGILVLSRSGEGYLQTYADSKKIYQTCLRKARAAGLFMMATIGDPTPGGLDLARFCNKLGVDAIVVLPALYYRPMTAQAVVNGIQLLAQCAPNTPVFLRIDPLAFLGLHLNYYEIYLLALQQVPNFAGIIASLEVCLQIRSCGKFNPKTQTMIASGQYAIQAASCVGIEGSVSVATSLVPDLAVGIWYAKDPADAARNQTQLNKLIASIASPRDYLSATKVAYGLINGACQGNVRTPIRPITCELERNVTKQLQKLGRVSNRAVSCCDCYN